MASSSADAAASMANDNSVEQMAIELQAQAVSSLPLLPSTDANKKRKPKALMNDAQKVDNTYARGDKMRLCVSHLEEVNEYLETLNDSKVKPAQDSISFCVESLKAELNKIDNTLNNTSAKKQSRRAYAKLNKEVRQRENSEKLETRGQLKLNPRQTLTSSLTALKKKDVQASAAKAASAVTSLPPRQQKKLKVADTKTNETSNTGKTKNFDIRLPRPEDGRKSYTPSEAIIHVEAASDNVVQLSGTENKNIHRTFLKEFKQKMINDKMVPVQISALNDLVKNYGVGTDKPPPVFWDTRGRPDIINIQELYDAWKKQQSDHTLTGWSKVNTKNFVWDALRALKGDDTKAPCAETVDAYHSALMSMPGVTQRSAKSKPTYRQAAETSLRSLCANIAVMIATRCIILPSGNVPVSMKLDEAKATTGCLKARQLYAKAMDAAEQSVFFTPRHLLTNVDDKASIYNDHQGDGNCTGNPNQTENVLVDSQVLAANPSYAPHNNKDGTRQLRGIKTRMTQTITGGGKMANPWVQVLDFSDAEMPQDNVIAIPIKGLTPDSNVNAQSTAVGYLVLVKKGQGNETEMFRKYDEIVHDSLVDTLLTSFNIDPKGEIPSWARSIYRMDGGVPQLTATKDPANLDRKVARNEDVVKFSKNTSALVQSCDVGNGFARVGHWAKKIGPDDVATVDLIPTLTHAIEQLRQSGRLVITATKANLIVAAASRYPTIIRKSYEEKGILQAEVRTGWLDKSLQGCDVEVMMNNIKTELSDTWKAKILRDLIVFIREVLQYGFIRELTFERLEYPVDVDQHGGQHLIPEDAIITSHHRQRATIMTTPALLDRFREQVGAAAASQETAQSALVVEQNWRKEQLDANDECETMLHNHLKTPPEERDRSLFFNKECPLEVLSKRAFDVKAFVRVRKMTSSTDESFQEPSHVGTRATVLATRQMLESNNNHQLTVKENSWMWRAYHAFREPLTLTLLDDADMAAAEEQAAERQAEEEAAAAAGMPSLHSNAVSYSSRQPIEHTLSKELLVEVKPCLSGCNVETIITTTQMKRKIETLAAKLKQRLTNFMTCNIPNSPDLQYHWVFNAFFENIHVLAQLLASLGQVNNSIDAMTVQDSLLKPLLRGYFAKAATLPTLQGVVIYQDNETCRWCNAAIAIGNGKSFSTLYDEDLAKSKTAAASNTFPGQYPFNRPLVSGKGSYSGLFGGLTMYSAIGFVPNSDTSCLTRVENGVFHWSPITMKQLHETDISGAATIETKQLNFICLMLEFVYTLMLDAKNNVEYTPFKPIIGRTINLRR